MKKIISLLLVGCLSISLLAGCKKEEQLAPTVDIESVVGTETASDDSVRETASAQVEDSETAVILFEGNSTVIDLVEVAYNNMASAMAICGTSTYVYSDGSSDVSTIVWNNESSNLKTMRIYDCAGSTEGHVEDESCNTRVTQYLICEDGVYTEFTVTESLEDGSVVSVNKAYFNGDSSDDFRELFSGLFSASLQEEPVDLNGRPHYYLKANPEWFGTYDAYIDCETSKLSRLELNDDSFQFFIDFEESDELIEVPAEVLDSTKDIVLENKPEAQSYVLMPSLGGPELGDMKSFNIGGVDIIIGETLGSVLNAQFDGWHCGLDAYYNAQGYITDDGGKVPADSYVMYYIESEDEDYSGIIAVYAVNNTDVEIDVEDCVIACFGMLYATEYVYGRPVTMLDMCIAQGGDYSFIENNIGVLGTWHRDHYDIYISNDYDELAILYVVNEELFEQFYLQ